ncbi:hypothetical protein Tco_1545068, partial [Tanacetum coccineum]
MRSRRIYGFYIHYRFPPVERLLFHLPNEQSIIFDERDSLDYTLDKASVNEIKFQAWMETNKTDNFAQSFFMLSFQSIMYGSMMKRFGNEGKRVKVLDVYITYLLLGVKCFIYEYCLTRLEAYYAHGLLEDDKEYIDRLLEASHWGMGNYLRRFFVMLIMTDNMSRPEFVYEKTWHVMTTDVESIERVKKNDPAPSQTENIYSPFIFSPLQLYQKTQ